MHGRYVRGSLIAQQASLYSGALRCQATMPCYAQKWSREYMATGTRPIMAAAGGKLQQTAMKPARV